MKFKLLVVFVEDSKTEKVLEAARDSGATGCTIINHARGEGIKAHKSFLGMALTSQRDVVLMLVEEHLSRQILEHVGEIGGFDAEPGTGLAVQINVEDAIGIMHQADYLADIVEDKL